jgi:hypothetical protein
MVGCKESLIRVGCFIRAYNTLRMLSVVVPCTAAGCSQLPAHLHVLLLLFPAGLKKKLKDLMGEFSEMRARIHDENRQVVQRRVYTVTGQHLPEEDIDAMIETGEAGNVFCVTVCTGLGVCPCAILACMSGACSRAMWGLAGTARSCAGRGGGAAACAGLLLLLPGRLPQLDCVTQHGAYK